MDSNPPPSRTLAEDKDHRPTPSPFFQLPPGTQPLSPQITSTRTGLSPPSAGDHPGDSPGLRRDALGRAVEALSPGGRGQALWWRSGGWGGRRVRGRGGGHQDETCADSSWAGRTEE